MVPTANEATEITYSSFVANWASLDGTTKFLVDVSDNGFKSLLPSFSSMEVNGNSLLVGGLTDGAAYSYRVKAMNESGMSAFSNTVDVNVKMAIHGAPDSLAAKSTMDGIVLSWKDLSDNEQGFIIERKDDNNGYVAIDTIKQNTNKYKDATVGTNTRYTYRVYAYLNNTKSAYSNEGSALTFPAVPTAMEATEVGISSFVANWGTSDSATSFMVEVSGNGKKQVLPASSLSLLINGLEENSTYSYKVKAVNESGESKFSNAITVKTMEIALSAPTELAASKTTGGILLNWTDASGNETGFIIERKEDNGKFMAIDTVGANIVTYTDLNISIGAPYTYRVAAYLMSTLSGYSNEAEFSIITGTKPTFEKELIVSPNPSNDVFNISFYNEHDKIKSIRVFNTNGKILMDNKVKCRGDNKTFELDLSKFGHGIYLLVFETEKGETGFTKLFKQ